MSPDRIYWQQTEEKNVVNEEQLLEDIAHFLNANLLISNISPEGIIERNPDVIYADIFEVQLNPPILADVDEESGAVYFNYPDEAL